MDRVTVKSTCKGRLVCANGWFSPTTKHYVQVGDTVFGVSEQLKRGGSRMVYYCGWCHDKKYGQDYRENSPFSDIQI